MIKSAGKMHKFVIRLASLLLAFAMITGLTSCSFLDDIFAKRAKGLIVFSMQTGNKKDDDSNYELYIMDADGEKPKRLTNTEDINEGAPSLSADGLKIVFICQVDGPNFKGGGGSLSVMDIDGGNRQDFSYLGYSPYFSEDSSRIFLYCGSEFMSFSVDGSDEKVLMNSQIGNIDPNRFLVTEKEYVFLSDDEGFYQIYSVNHDGSDSRPITDFEEGIFGLISLSPDQKNMIIQTSGDRFREHPDRGLYLIDLKSLERTRLTDSNGYVQKPVFSPDGSTVYYPKLTPEGLFICAIDTDGTSDRVVTKITSDQYASLCVFSKDGKQIWFISGNKLFRCDADGSNRTQITEEKTLHPNYAWIPE
jgi:Tol biopolymer transport system component